MKRFSSHQKDSVSLCLQLARHYHQKWMINCWFWSRRVAPSMLDYTAGLVLSCSISLRHTAAMTPPLWWRRADNLVSLVWCVSYSHDHSNVGEGVQSRRGQNIWVQQHQLPVDTQFTVCRPAHTFIVFSQRKLRFVATVGFYSWTWGHCVSLSASLTCRSSSVGSSAPHPPPVDSDWYRPASSGLAAWGKTATAGPPRSSCTEPQSRSSPEPSSAPAQTLIKQTTYEHFPSFWNQRIPGLFYQV